MAASSDNASARMSDGPLEGVLHRLHPLLWVHDTPRPAPSGGSGGLDLGEEVSARGSSPFSLAMVARVRRFCL